MINIARVGVSTPSFFLFLSEAVLIYVSVFLSNILRAFFACDTIPLDTILIKGFPIVGAITLSMYYLDGYSGYFYARRREFLFFWLILQAVALGYIILSIFYYIFPEIHLGRGILLGHFLIATVVLYVWRLLFSWIFPKTKFFNRRAIILGNDNLSESLQQALRELNYSGFLVSHTKEVKDEKTTTFLEELWPQGIRYIIVTQKVLENLPMEFLWQTHLFGYQIIDGRTLYEWITGKVPYQELQARDILFVYHPENFVITRFLKRIMDIVLSILGILLSLPFQIIIAVLIKITSKGPIFYIQERTGLHERRFMIYKYRTMTTDAEKSGPQQAKKNDPRVTSIGKYLRRTRFDELPQLWNILKGEMSLIGPRPERPHFTDEYKEKIPYYFLRHSVRPGLTGWAQVKHEYTNDFEGTCEKFRHDLYYIKHFSLGLDFIILVKTVKVVLTGAGAK